MRIPFKTLDTIAWHSLQHSEGSAADIPNHLRNLVSEDRTQAAASLEELEIAIGCPELATHASFLAIPFLVEALSATSCPVRSGIIELLDELVSRQDAETSPLHHRLVDAVDAQAGHIAKLLDEPDDRLRAHAVTLLGALPSLATHQPRCVALANRDPQPVVRAAALWALGRARGSRATQIGIVSLSDEQPIVCYVAALVVVGLNHVAGFREATRVLLDSNLNEAPADYDRLPLATNIERDAQATLASSYENWGSPLIEAAQERGLTAEVVRTVTRLSFRGPNVDLAPGDLNPSQCRVGEWLRRLNQSGDVPVLHQILEDHGLEVLIAGTVNPL